jgi:hypothetical protein
VPSWSAPPLGDEAPEVFIVKPVNLGTERESLFLGGFLIFVWSAPQGLIVIRIHNNQNPPTIVIIACDADLNGVLLHVGFIQVDCESRRNVVLDLIAANRGPVEGERQARGSRFSAAASPACCRPYQAAASSG